MTESHEAIPVDGDRLWADLEANGAFGATEGPGHGRTAPLGSEANRLARERFVDRLEDAGLTVRIDRVGNVVGRWTPPSADPDAAPVATGSHLDSVPEGGIFDGPLGVYAGLEAVRAMRAADAAPERPIEVVSFTEEEGARFAILLGSSVATGLADAETVLAAEHEGETAAAALERIGFAGEGLLDASAWDSWLELHVEQGRRLERAGLPVGVVTDVTGLVGCRVRIEGAADHAGTTPMAERTDAFAAACEFGLDVERAAGELAAAGPGTTVGTVGTATVRPGATNVIPGAVELGLDLRDVDRDRLDRLVDRVGASLARIERDRGVTTSLERTGDLDPTPMADRVRAAAHGAAGRAGLETTDLHSGAGHDSQHVARVTDAGMLFAPSRDGVSHSPAEWTEPEDCAAATRVLAGALADLAGA